MRAQRAKLLRPGWHVCAPWDSGWWRCKRTLFRLQRSSRQCAVLVRVRPGMASEVGALVPPSPCAHTLSAGTPRAPAPSLAATCWPTRATPRSSTRSSACAWCAPTSRSTSWHSRPWRAARTEPGSTCCWPARARVVMVGVRGRSSGRWRPFTSRWRQRRALASDEGGPAPATRTLELKCTTECVAHDEFPCTLKQPTTQGGENCQKPTEKSCAAGKGSKSCAACRGEKLLAPQSSLSSARATRARQQSAHSTAL